MVQLFVRTPVPEPFAGLIDSWLLEDRRCWFERRHTAKRVYDRLVGEKGFESSYTTVQRYVRRRRGELAAELDAREAQGFLLPGWLPGECQVDFGQADFRVRGVVTRGHFLEVALPRPDVGLALVFWDETAECVRQGLSDVFEFLGGVPLRAVPDDATEVGRRVGAEIRASVLFRRFAAHHGLDHGLTNPYPGNEKGSAGNEVGALRRNLFVPVPQVWDVKAYNGRLLGACPGLSDGKPRYRRGIPESELFGDDRLALSPLPATPCACVTRPDGKRGRRGSFRAGGEHRYSAGPTSASREVAAERPREWGDTATDSVDPALRLRLLCACPGGWRDGVVRGSLPEGVVTFPDPGGARRPRRGPRGASRRGRQAGLDRGGGGRAALSGATSGVDTAALELAAARAAAGDAAVEYDEPAGLAGYDRAFELPEGAAASASSVLVSKATIAWFLETATPGQLAARSGMLTREPGGASIPERSRLVRQARLPVSKAVEGFDWSNVRFPEGWSRDDNLAAAIVGRVVRYDRLVEFGSPSHRLEESSVLGKLGS